MRRASLKERIYHQYRLLKEGVEVVTETKLGGETTDTKKETTNFLTGPIYIERSKVIKWRSKGY